MIPVIVQLAACASVKRGLPEAKSELATPSQAPAPYLIQPGDILESHYAVDPTLNQQALVAPDGRVSFRYASNIVAAGLALPDVRTAVVRAAGIIDPGFDVVLRSSIGTRVYVLGEVTTPGEVQVNGEISALQAVSRAGGFKLGAQKSEILLLRRGLASQPKAYVLNLDDATNGIGSTNDVELRTYDVVYVPRDRAGNLSEIFERIRQAIPFNFSVFYGSSTGRLF